MEESLGIAEVVELCISIIPITPPASNKVKAALGHTLKGDQPDHIPLRNQSSQPYKLNL